MSKSAFIIISAIASLLLATGCSTENISDRSEEIESCYHTGFAIKCISTPGAVGKDAIDVDGDNEVDPFVCGDGVSASDSDGTGEDSDSSSEADAEGEDDLDADSDSDSDSASDSDSDCGVSESISDSDSESDAEGDGDADGVSDESDCDCLDAIPPTDGEKPPVL